MFCLPIYKLVKNSLDHVTGRDLICKYIYFKAWSLLLVCRQVFRDISMILKSNSLRIHSRSFKWSFSHRPAVYKRKSTLMQRHLQWYYSDVAGVSPRRRLLIPPRVSEVQSRCSKSLFIVVLVVVMTSSSNLSQNYGGVWSRIVLIALREYYKQEQAYRKEGRESKFACFSSLTAKLREAFLF